MKSKMLFLLLVSLVSFPAIAAEKFVCVEYDRKTKKLNQNIIVLTALDEKGSSYQLESFKGAQVVPEWKVEGSVTTEDVSFDFESKNKEVNFYMYLDEMNECGLSVKGVKMGSYICR